jgi:hypothetical protein
MGNRLDHDAAGPLRFVHVRSEVLRVAGQQMRGLGCLGGEQDRAILLRQIDRDLLRRWLRNLGYISDQLTKPLLALRVFCGNVPPRLFDSAAAGNKFPALRAQLIEEEGRLAIGIVRGRKQDIRI